MGFRHGGHRDRSTHKGEEYVRMYRLTKWINQCIQCQERGYNPKVLDDVARYQDAERKAYHHYRLMLRHYAVNYVRKHFKPLPLDERGLCELCSKR